MSLNVRLSECQTRCCHEIWTRLNHEFCYNQFIQSLLVCQIQFIYSLIYNAICSLKCAQNLKALNLSWFSEWWKQNELHKIKTKSLTVICLTAQQEQKIVCWFKEYQTTVWEYEIKRRNIVNFDETEFQVDCFKD